MWGGKNCLTRACYNGVRGSLWGKWSACRLRTTILSVADVGINQELKHSPSLLSVLNQ